MEQFVVIGTSPFADTSIAVGPFRSRENAQEASSEMEYKGWVTEICPLSKAADVEMVWSGEDI